MRLKNIFLGFLLLLAVLFALIFFLWSGENAEWIFFALEGWIILLLVYLYYFYRRIIKPLYTLSNGMDLLKEQDFSSRLGHVGQKETDRIVDVFNRMMEQLKNERLHVREQNHFLDLLIQASPMGVLILDFDGRILSVNPAVCRVLHLADEKDLLGLPLALCTQPLLEEIRNIPLDSSRSIRLSDANIYKCSHSFFMDRGLRHEFYLIEVLTHEVFKAEKKAYEKVIRMISHEVNNTTAGITSTLDTLEASFQGMEDMAEVSDILRVLIERCYGMSRFITNFADVVRIPEPQIKSVALNELVSSCKRFMENLCVGKQIRIHIELEEELPPVKIDPILFEQVMVNIIKNAVEAIGENGDIYIRTSHHPLCLEIGDTGAGISKETEAKLFSPFFSTKPNGQGIGLIFIREVLLKHGCSFSLKTYSDGVTRFKIWF